MTVSNDQATCRGNGLFTGTTTGPSAGSDPYYCDVYDTVGYNYYFYTNANGADTTKNLYTLSTLVPSVTSIYGHAKGRVYFYGSVPNTVTTINFSVVNAISIADVIFDISTRMPLSLVTFTGGTGNDVVLLAPGWQNVSGFTANGNAGTLDTIGIPDLNQLNYYSGKISNFEYIDIGGHAAISFDLTASGFRNTNSGMIGYTISSPLTGAITFTNNPTTVSTLKFYASPGNSITIPNTLSLNIYLDDTMQRNKDAVSVANTLTAASATSIVVYSYGSIATTKLTGNSITSALTAASATTLTISGSKTVSVDLTNSASIASITSAGMTSGGCYVTSIAGGTVTSVVGSAYNDTYKFLSGTFVSTVIINAGAGVDTINLLTSAEMTTVNLANSRNFEIIDLGGTTGSFGSSSEFLNFLSYNINAFGIAVNANLAGAITLTGIPLQLNQFYISATLTSGISFSYAGGGLKESLTLILDDANGPVAGGITVSSFTTTNIGTLNIISQGSGANTISSLTLTNLQDLVITGIQPLSISSIPSAARYNIDASGMTGSGYVSLTSIYSGAFGVNYVGSPNGDSFLLTTTNAANYTVKGLGGQDTFDKRTASTTGSISYRYDNETDGGSAYGVIASGSTILSIGGDTITDTVAAAGNAFVTTVDKFVISGTLKASIQASQTGITLSSSAPGAANTIDFSVDKSGIIFYATATASGNLATTTLAGVLATINTAITTVTNETVGCRRIIVLQDGNNTGFAVYAFKSITADNAITANEILLLAIVTAGDAGNVVASDFSFI